MSSKLKLKKDEPAEETLTCPDCGAPMPVGAVLCVQCGYDTRTQRKAGESGGKKQNPLLIGALGVVILGAIAIVALRMFSSSSPAPVPPAPQVAAVAADTTTAVAAETTPEAAPVEAVGTNEAATAEEAPATAEDATTNGEEVVEEEQEPEVPAIDWAAVEAEQIERATALLDTREPLFQAGEVIELRMTNGIIQRGEFKGLSEGLIVLAVATDDVRRVEVEALDRASRIRMQPEYRQSYIKFVVQKRIAELQRAAETNAP